MSKSGAAATSVSPPSGSGHVAGMGEAFSLDLNSGQGTFSLPFELPAGVAGFKPNLALEYRHGNGNGPFGLGWRLGERQIERRLDHGVPGEGTVEVFLDSGTELRRGEGAVYHPVRELSFSHYERVDDHWVVSERDGSRSFFGQTAAARVTDPQQPERVQSWLLERREDVNGNAIEYRYTAWDGQPYLTEVTYAAFVVRLDYEPRPDIVVNGRAGFVRRVARRCHALRLLVADENRTVRTLTLEYENAPLSRVSLLVSARLTAHGDGQPDVAKNPVTFGYSDFAADAPRVRWLDTRPGDPEPPPLSDPDTALIGLDDVPLRGILSNRGGRHAYWPYDGEGGWAHPRLPGDTPLVTSFVMEGVQFVDMDGTGAADMLVGAGTSVMPGYYENRGRRGFGGFAAYPRQARAAPPLSSGRVRLGDLDGDGVIDAVYSAQRGLVSYRNRSRAGWSEPTIAANAPRADFADPLTFLADMTGDGLPDIVRVRSGRVEYWLNLGHGRYGERVEMANSPRLSGVSRAPDHVLLMDVDGDGCSDLVRVTQAGVEVYVNQSGHGFAPAVIVPTVPAPVSGTVHAVDLDGRGSAGLLYDSWRSGRTGMVHVAWRPEAPPYVLQRIDNGNGLVSEIEYTPMVQMALQDRASGEPWHTRMPFPVWLVSATREADAVRGVTSEVRYRYRDGHFDPLFRRFQGFGRVERLEVGDESRADVVTVYAFLMDQAGVPGREREYAHLDRLLARVEVFSRDGTALEGIPYRIEETEYGLRHLGSLADGTKRTHVYVERTRRRYRERTEDERVEERAFEYDAFGNVTRETVRGFGNEGGVPAPVKQVVTEIAYATDGSQRRFQPARTVKRNADGGIVMEVRRYYDGLPLGELDAGLMTREEHLVLSLDAFETHYAGMALEALGYVRQDDADGVPSVFALEIERAYTPAGNVASEVTGGGRSTDKTYDADGLHVVEERVNGKISRRRNDRVSGKPLSLVAHSGAEARMTYDALGRLQAFMVADDTPENPTRALQYDDASVPHALVTSRRIAGGARARSVTYYDGRGQEVQTRVERGPAEVVVSGWMLSNPWQQTKAEFEPTLADALAFSVPPTAGRPSRRIRFDGEGRPVRTVNYNGAVGTASFTPFQIVTHDAHDLDDAHPNARTPRRERVDVWNHRTSVEEVGGEGERRSTHYRVGLFGELLELADGTGPIAAYTYDMRGNQLSLEHRDAGRREQWYDSHGDVVRSRDAEGNDVDVDRDAEGRITAVRHAGATVEAFTYDDVTPGVDGRMVSARYASGQQGFEYEARGFLRRHTVRVGDQDFSIGYEHNDMGRQTAVIYPDGRRLTREHTLNGLVRRIEGVVDEIVYDARNLPVRIAFANGVTTTIEYAPGVGHIIRQHTTGPTGAVLDDVRFSYDALMQLSGREDTAPGIERHLTYAYDPLGQLVRVAGSDRGQAFTHAYTYANGYNLADIGENGWQLDFDDAARPDRPTRLSRQDQPAFGFTYDGNGGTTSLPGRELAYDFKNQLEQVTLADGTVVRYDYDYRGNRVRRQVTKGGRSSETVFLGRLAEIRAGQVTNYVVLDGRRIAVMAGATTRWLHLDPVGSITFFSDDDGAVLAQTSYYPYGNQRSSSGTPPLRVFALHDVDEATELVYMGNRWYAPGIGRFLTPDPLYLYKPERSDGSTVRLHLYTYAGNSPLDRVDPAGLSFWSVVGAIVGVVVGIALAVAVVAAFATGIGFGLLVVAGVIGLVTVSYVVAHNNQGNALGEFFRGFMIGLNAGLNAAFLTMMGPVGAFLGGFVGTMIFLSAFDSVAANGAYQGILGWSNWLMPMSWLVIGLGAVMWILNGLGHLLFWSIPSLWGGGLEFFRITGFRMDWSTGMLATRGGWVANLNQWDTAYNMGTFAYVDANSSGWHMAHEAGHNLNLAAFGSAFHFIGFFHEIGGAGRTAFAEIQAESNNGGPGMWSS